MNKSLCRAAHQNQISNVIGFRHPNQTTSSKHHSKSFYFIPTSQCTLCLTGISALNACWGELCGCERRTGIYQHHSVNGRRGVLQCTYQTKTSTLTTMMSKKSNRSRFGGIFNLRRVQDKDKRTSTLSLSAAAVAAAIVTAYIGRQYIFYLSVDCFLYLQRRAYCCIFVSLWLTRISWCWCAFVCVCANYHLESIRSDVHLALGCITNDSYCIRSQLKTKIDRCWFFSHWIC